MFDPDLIEPFHRVIGSGDPAEAPRCAVEHAWAAVDPRRCRTASSGPGTPSRPRTRTGSSRSRDSVRFGQGGDSVASHPIASLEAREEADRILYELRYDNDGKRYTFTFYREPSGTITFRHQAGISWSRTR